MWTEARRLIARMRLPRLCQAMGARWLPLMASVVAPQSLRQWSLMTAHGLSGRLGFAREVVDSRRQSPEPQWSPRSKRWLPMLLPGPRGMTWTASSMLLPGPPQGSSPGRQALLAPQALSSLRQAVLVRLPGPPQGSSPGRQALVAPRPFQRTCQGLPWQRHQALPPQMQTQKTCCCLEQNVFRNHGRSFRMRRPVGAMLTC